MARSAPKVLRGWLNDVIAAVPFVAETMRTIKPLVWAKFAAWLIVARCTSTVELLGPFLIASATYFVYCFGFRERGEAEESAYTVFNRNFRALPGQLRAEELERNVVAGI